MKVDSTVDHKLTDDITGRPDAQGWKTAGIDGKVIDADGPLAHKSADDMGNDLEVVDHKSDDLTSTGDALALKMLARATTRTSGDQRPV